MDITSSTIGKISSIELAVGDTVNSGLPFLQIEVSDDAAEKDEKDSNNTDKKNHTVNEESENIKSEQLANIEKPKNSLNTSNTNNANIYAGPAVRKLAREFGIELSQVQPTGPKNRIQKEDLHLFVKSRLSATPQKNSFEFSQPDIDYSKWGPTKEQKLSKFQKSSLANLHTPWINNQHVTQQDECDLTQFLEAISQ